MTGTVVLVLGDRVFMDNSSGANVGLEPWKASFKIGSHRVSQPCDGF
jgi:hypothetical protein